MFFGVRLCVGDAAIGVGDAEINLCYVYINNNYFSFKLEFEQKSNTCFGYFSRIAEYTFE